MIKIINIKQCGVFAVHRRQRNLVTIRAVQQTAVTAFNGDGIDRSRDFLRHAKFNVVLKNEIPSVIAMNRLEVGR